MDVCMLFICWIRYTSLDSKSGIIHESSEKIKDIYPASPIEDVAAGIRGSCSSYYTRKNITNQIISLSLDEVSTMYVYILN